MTTPKRRRRSNASYTASTCKHEYKHHIDDIDHRSGAVWVEGVTPGDASISVGQSIKYWQGGPSDGYSIESSCSVGLSCEQTKESIDHARQIAADLALGYALDGMVQLERESEYFLKGKTK